MHPVFFGMRNVYEETMNQASFKPMSKSRKSGFTLMELLVYIAIVGIVVIVAGQAFSNSTKMRVRTQSMLKASEVAENVATLLKTDIAQMGAKSSLETHVTNGSDDIFSDVKSLVFIDPENDTEANKDSSSFKFVPTNPSTAENLQKFIMRRVRYTSVGKYAGVEQITWSLDGKVLKRTCETLDGDGTDDCAPKGTSGDNLDSYTVEMATGVESFKILPAVPWHKDGVADDEDEYLVFPDATGEFRFVQRYDESDNILPLVVGEGGSSIMLKGFASNYTEANGGEISTDSDKKRNEVYAFPNLNLEVGWKSFCQSHPIHLESNVVYELSFGVRAPVGSENAIKAFIPTKDHMAVGFRNKDGQKVAGINDFAFFPPADTSAKEIERKMRFSTNTNVDACIAFTFSFYSPAAAAVPIVFSNLRLRVAENASYKFDNSVTSVSEKYKKHVKAFQLTLKVTRDGEAGEATLVIPTPSNGPTD